MRLSPKLSLFLVLAWTLVLFGGWALLAEMTSEAAPLAYDPDLEFKVLAHIPVGDDPRGIAVVGDKVYVANHDDDSLSVIDANTLTVTQIISAGISNPCSMAYNPNNGYLYVTNRPDSGNGTVAVISPTTGLTVTNPIVVEEKPTGIAYNPNDGCIYVANFGGGGTISVISDTGVIKTIENGIEPSHVGINPVTNLVYVTDHWIADSDVIVIDGATRSYSQTVHLTAGQAPWGIAVNSVTNKIYVATIDASRLVIIDGDDLGATPVYTNPGEYNLRMVAVDPIQNLVFVTQDDTDTTGGSSSHDGPPSPQMEKVLIYDPETNDWVDELEITVQQDPERGIAFDPVRHRLYVSNRISDTVTVIQESIKLYFPIIMKASS